MRHFVVVNPQSFHKKEEYMSSVIGNISAYFENVAKAEYTIYISRYPRDAINAVNEYVTATEDTVRVYSVGGDGILSDCLNGLVKLPNAELAIIPYGTSNDFVRAFGEGKNAIFRDIAKQAVAPSIPTDIISISGKYVLNFCSIGFGAAVVIKYYELCKRYPLLLKILGKSLYTAGIPFAFFDKNITLQKYEVLIDGERYDGVYMGIDLANGSRYGGTQTPFPMAHPADGQMEIMLHSCRANPYFFIVAKDFIKGRYYKHPKVLHHKSAKEVVIRSNAPIYVNVDGETFCSAKIDAKIIPSAVKIVAPDRLEYVRSIKDDN
ncbi:MAG: hypothetical protein FWE05_02895 [Defluviitaleaceae bacterium]|nr:hypothetical protein [Defluviitaleaceae bacterium]